MISNPSIGYGNYFFNTKNGTKKEFSKIGLSANTTGISVYIMGIDDKIFLIENFGKEFGKAKISGYCIKFKELEDIQLNVLEKTIRTGIETTNPKKF